MEQCLYPFPINASLDYMSVLNHAHYCMSVLNHAHDYMSVLNHAHDYMSVLNHAHVCKSVLNQCFIGCQVYAHVYKSVLNQCFIGCQVSAQFWSSIFPSFVPMQRKLADGLFLESCRKISKSYPDIEFTDMIIDNASMQVGVTPCHVIVTLVMSLWAVVMSV